MNYNNERVDLRVCSSDGGTIFGEIDKLDSFIFYRTTKLIERSVRYRSDRPNCAAPFEKGEKER